MTGVYTPCHTRDMNTATAIQVRVICHVTDSYAIPTWTIVSKNQQTVVTVSAKNLGGYGRVARVEG